MRHAAFWSVCGITVLAAAQALAAANGQLKGDYAFNGEASCIVSQAGFTNADGPLTGAAAAGTPLPSQNSFSVQGIRHFNGDGTGTITVHSVGISSPVWRWTNPGTGITQTTLVNPGGASSEDTTASFTYEVDAHGVITTQVTADGFTGTVLTGFRADESVERTNVEVLTGQILDGGNVITLASNTPTVETVTFAPTVPSQPAGLTQFEICHRARVLLKLDGVPGGGP